MLTSLERASLVAVPRRKKLRHTLVNGTKLRVGANEHFPDMDAAMAYMITQTWESSDAMTGVVSMTAGSEMVTGLGTDFIHEIGENDFILVGSQYHAVRDIWSDKVLRLWAGAKSNQVEQAATAKKLSKFLLELTAEEDEITAQYQLLSGVSLAVAGEYKTNRLIALGADAIKVNGHNYLEVANLRLQSDLPTGMIGMDIPLSFLGNGYSVLNMHDLVIDNAVAGGIAFMYGSAVTMDNITGRNFQMNIGGDFIDLTNVHNVHMSDGDDGWLFNAQGTHMGAYEHNLINTTCNKVDLGGALASHTTNVEWNLVTAPNKVMNMTDSVFHSTMPSSEAGMFRTSSDIGTYNFTDCILEGDPAEINKQGTTEVINLVRTTRADGTAVREA